MKLKMKAGSTREHIILQTTFRTPSNQRIWLELSPSVPIPRHVPRSGAVAHQIPKQGPYFARRYSGYALKQSTIVEVEASRAIFEADSKHFVP